ncbi:hypothetical protein AB0I81_04440 [Nonomuraea sp. NPDC050404]|uniref:hypothetical protein n=1 Tax=Nonomuraea sp. NPDC050404 TaxID=3155783 RepID=UPI00340E82CB
MSRALIVSGHLVDTPGRQPPRFPQRLVGRVTEEMKAIFDEWDVGPGTVVVCGGARGADLIGAGLAQDRGARVIVCLALPREEFLRRSVDLPGTDWRARFERLTRSAQVEPPPYGTAAGDEVFAEANERMVRLARELDPEPLAVAVWDGRPGDGPGGTHDLVTRLGYEPGDRRMRVIRTC